MKKDDCVFCKIANGEITHKFIFESDNFLVFDDDFPKVKGHTLIVPRKHFENILDMPASLGSELIDNIKLVAEKRLKEGAEGFNIVQNNFEAAGQVVMHAHFHFLPRKKSDGLKFGI